MNDLEKKLIKYENDAIAYETGEGKIAPNMFISPNECLILLNIKNTELRELRHANAVLTGACDMWADKYEALQAQLAQAQEAVEEARKVIRIAAEKWEQGERPANYYAVLGSKAAAWLAEEEKE